MNDAAPTPPPDEPGDPPEPTYRLVPPEPRAGEAETFVRVDPASVGAPRPAPMQFSLREMFLLTTLTAAGLGLLRAIPGGLAPATAAGVTGFVLIAARLLLWLFQVDRPIVFVAWWLLLAGYLLTCLGAVLQGP